MQMLSLDRSCLFNMKVSFKLGETTLDTAEASALFSATEVTPDITVDILDHIDVSIIDAKKLFSLSVEKKNPTLATLAAKFAIEGIQKPAKRKRSTEVKRIIDIEQVKHFDDPSEAIAALIEMNNLRAVGAAMILYALKQGQKKTLRQIAVTMVNEMAYRGEVSADSDCFKGFVKDVEGNLRPISKAPGIKRTECFHASPVYQALREGLSLLCSWGMTETTKTVEWGAKDKKIAPNSAASLLRRTVYMIELNEGAKQLSRDWADIGDFITMMWSKRVRASHRIAG